MVYEADLEDFELNYKDAIAYHRRAEQFLSEGQRSSLVFNVAAVALERYLVALCDLHSVSPRNHNFMSLMSTLDKATDFPLALSKRIKSLDLIFGICSIDEYRHPNPDPIDADRVLSMCKEVADLFNHYQAKIDQLRTLIINN